MATFRIKDYAAPFQVLGFRRLMSSAPAWDRERLAAWSESKRRALLLHAANKVPFYRERLSDHAIDANDADVLSIWEHLPILSKQDYLSAPEAFLSDDAERRGGFWASTSGSTGMPFRIRLDANVNAAAFALFWRAWNSGGAWKLGQRQAAMKDSTHVNGWRYNPLIRTLELSASHVAEETVREFAKLLHRYKPRLIRGYPSSLYIFCRLLEKHSIEVNVPVIISVAESLHDFQRKTIEGTLSGRLYNHYTHWERAASILECQHGSMHAQEDYSYHEIVDDDGKVLGPGQTGYIVGTSLHNYAMPMIRYFTGDVGIWSDRVCECGQSFPVVERVMGRNSDFLVKQDGTLVSATYAVSTFVYLDRIVYAQIIQTLPGVVEFRVVPDKDFSMPADLESAKAALQKRLGEDMKIDARTCRVEELERSPVGKIRSCYTKVDLGKVLDNWPDNSGSVVGSDTARG